MFGVEICYGNGYRCSCCRTEHEVTEEFDTFKKAMHRVAEIEFVKKNYKRLRALGLCGSDDDDVCVLQVTEFKVMNLDNLEITSVTQKLLDNLILKEAEKEAEERKGVEESAVQKQIDRRKQYKSLKEEFEGGES